MLSSAETFGGAMKWSARKLEREFFRAFFALLVTRQGCEHVGWRDAKANARFRRVFALLEEEAESKPELDILVQRLRPDPISGACDAFNEHLVHLQPGNVSAPNPGYEEVFLAATKTRTDELVKRLPSELRSILPAAVDAFAGVEGKGNGERDSKRLSSDDTAPAA